nr:retrovirus-related Pol polyprotein from transposon TNT 1-94 [Tanacetum cinerariifolium]
SDFEEINGDMLPLVVIQRVVRSLMCDKKNSVLFTDTECLVLSHEFKLPYENQVLLRVPRDNNMYNVDLKNIVPSGDLTCHFAKATLDETLIEASRTMLADSLLPIPFWAEAVNTACYVQNRVLVTKPQNKTPYELLLGKTPSIGFMRPFCCPVTIFNTLDPLGKFDGKVDEGFLVGYSVNSIAFRVFNSRTRIIQETLHINFLENKPSVTGSGPTWLFDIDTLTKTISYQPVTAGNQSNPSASIQEQFDAEKAREDNVQQYVLFPVWSSGFKNPQNTDRDAAFKVKEPKFEGRNTESEVYVSPSSSAQTKKHDDKTK